MEYTLQPKAASSKEVSDVKSTTEIKRRSNHWAWGIHMGMRPELRPKGQLQ